MVHIILFGDSIFDNRPYIHPDEPEVVQQLQAAAPPQWRATLLAVDGDVIDSVHRQLDRLPADATHLVLSVGGNDALGEQHILTEPARIGLDVFSRLASIRAAFAERYERLLDRFVATGLPVVVCTIYQGRPTEEHWHAAATALAAFNDVIIRAAASRGVPVIDLRAICCEPEHYANPIEPSAAGGERIANTIASVVAHHDFSRRETVLYTGPVTAAGDAG